MDTVAFATYQIITMIKEIAVLVLTGGFFLPFRMNLSFYFTVEN